MKSANLKPLIEQTFKEDALRVHMVGDSFIYLGYNRNPIAADDDPTWLVKLIEVGTTGSGVTYYSYFAGKGKYNQKWSEHLSLTYENFNNI